MLLSKSSSPPIQNFLIACKRCFQTRLMLFIVSISVPDKAPFHAVVKFAAEEVKSALFTDPHSPVFCSLVWSLRRARSSQTVRCVLVCLLLCLNGFTPVLCCRRHRCFNESECRFALFSLCCELIVLSYCVFLFGCLIAVALLCRQRVSEARFGAAHHPARSCRRCVLSLCSRVREKTVITRQCDDWWLLLVRWPGSAVFERCWPDSEFVFFALFTMNREDAMRVVEILVFTLQFTLNSEHHSSKQPPRPYIFFYPARSRGVPGLDLTVFAVKSVLGL